MVYKKKVIVITCDDKPILAVPVQELTSVEYLKLQKECQSNWADIIALFESKEKALNDKIALLEKEIKYLKGE